MVGGPCQEGLSKHSQVCREAGYGIFCFILLALELNMSATGLDYKRGHFTASEDSKLHQYINDYSATHELSPQDVQRLLKENVKTATLLRRDHLRKFWTDLALCTPMRPVQMVRQHVQEIFDTEKTTGPWTSEESSRADERVQNARFRLDCGVRNGSGPQRTGLPRSQIGRAHV